METVTDVEREARELGLSEETIAQMWAIRQKVISFYNNQMYVAQKNGLISTDTYLCHLGIVPQCGLYRDYPVIPTSQESLNKEGFFSSFMSSDQDAFMKSFIETIEKPREKGEYRPKKPLSLQQLILYELPKIIIKDLFMPDDKGKVILCFFEYINKRDGVRFAYLTQAYCAWMYGEILKNKPIIIEIAGVTVKDLEDYYLKIWDTHLFSYYITYFNAMFGKPNSYPHPLLVLTIYAREMLRITTGNDAQADALINTFENDIWNRAHALLPISLIGDLIIDVIQNKIAKKL